MPSATHARLRRGDAAPPAEVLTISGPVNLSALWSDGPILLTFLRHFG